jgi:hypothetical protein
MGGPNDFDKLSLEHHAQVDEVIKEIESHFEEVA